MTELPSTPTGWFAELRRRRMFRALAAYLFGAWLLLQIANVTFPPLGLPDWWQRVLIIALGVGIVPACILAWVFDITRHGIVRTGAAPAGRPTGAAVPGRSSQPVPGTPGKGIADAILETSGVQTAAAEAAERDTSIAILPFADLSPGKDQDWFCDGLAEEIIDTLCCVRRLRVASRTASFRYRDGSVDPREIGTQLNVGAVLEGSVRKAGDRLRITAQLIDTASGYHLWSESYDRRLEDVFAIQSEIARKVTAALRVSLTGEQAARLERHAPRDMKAHEFYLRGRQLIGTISVDAWRQAPAMFRRAIEIDPDYAQAHAGLADVLAQLSLWRFVRPDEVLPEAMRAAHRALELAPDLAEAHVALGHVRSLAGDSDGATRSFERALQLNPELFDAYHYFARHCAALGDHARAAELFQAAFALRPDDYTLLALAASSLEGDGRHAESLQLDEQALPGLLHTLELDPDDARAHYFAAGIFARRGEREAGIPHIEAALRLRPDDFATQYNAACYYSLAGNIDRAFEVLERACAFGGGSRGWLENDSDLAALHGDPRFAALLARLDDAATGTTKSPGAGTQHEVDDSG